MPIRIYTGLPGAGKSAKLAHTVFHLYKRNEKWYKKSGIKREIFSNLSISPDFIPKDWINYWGDPSNLTSLRNVDVVWDEMATHLDATQWANMSLELKRWLQQHRKFGVEIYGTAQSFSQVDISARRLVNELFWCKKVFGSRDPSATKPPVKRIWGLLLQWSLDPFTFDEREFKIEFQLPGILILRRSLIELFDTSQEIKMGKYPPLKHIDRVCELHGNGCDFKRIMHQ